MAITNAEKQRAYKARRWQKILAMPKIACACGCGTLIPPRTTQDKPAMYAHGHNAKSEDSPTRAHLFQRGQHAWNEGIYADPIPRFWEKVTKGDGCWEWTGALSRGYGQIDIEGKMVLAHRFSYELNVGPIPVGLRVCHHCDNRRCVNPAHLFLGTDADNMRDMVNKGRQKRQNGEANLMAKLTESDVRAIRAAIDTGPNIARRFGVSRQQVVAIRAGKRWAHLT